MRLLVGLSVLLLLLPPALATTFVDGTNGNEITTGVLRLEYDDTTSDQLLATAELPIETMQGLLLLVRTGNDTTYDFYARLSPGAVPQAIILHPGGLLMGEVRDGTDNLLVEKELIISCASTEEHITTDATGRFRVFLPLGDCTVSAASAGYAGSTSVTIAQGTVASLTLVVDRPVTDEHEQGFPWSSVLTIIIVLLVLAAFLWKRRGATAGKSSEKTGEEGKARTADSSAFLAERHKAALKEKERLVVDELLLRHGTARLSELRNATRIPRTSLLRCIEGLEQRGLLLKKEEQDKPVIELLKK